MVKKGKSKDGEKVVVSGGKDLKGSQSYPVQFLGCFKVLLCAQVQTVSNPFVSFEVWHCPVEPET